MLPSNLRLLQGIRAVLDDVGREQPAAQKQLASIGVAVNELMLRENREFFRAHYSGGRKLADRGARLAGDAVEPDLLTRLSELSPTLASNLHIEAMADELDRLSEVLGHIVGALARDERRQAAVDGFRVAVVDWDNALKAYHAGPAEAASEAVAASPSRFRAEAVTDYLRERLPHWREDTTASVKVLTGGFSKTTVMVEVQPPAGDLSSLVIRAEPEVSLLFLDGAQVTNEYCVLKLAHAAGLPVPEPLWVETDTAAFGARFLVSRKAAGRNFGTAISVDESISDSLLQDLMRNLARIHNLRVDPTDENVRRSHLATWSRHRTVTEATSALVTLWRENTDRLQLPPSASRSLLFKWLADNVPRSQDPPCLIHCDYGLHNVLIDNDRVAGILDWEGACISDPAEDFVWLADTLRGRASRAELMSLYVAAGGRPIPEDRLEYFEIFRTLKYAVVCPTSMQLFERHRSVHLAACQLGLVYPFFGSRDLNQHLAAADQALRAANRQ